jgi:hypothetical protein
MTAVLATSALAKSSASGFETPSRVRGYWLCGIFLTLHDVGNPNFQFPNLGH